MQNLADSVEWLLGLPMERRIFFLDYFFNTISEGFVILDKDLRYLYVNKALLDRRGNTADDYIGKQLLDIFPSLRDSPRYESYLKVLETGEPVVFNFASTEEDSDYLRITAFKVNYGLAILTEDLTRNVSFENTILELHRHARLLQDAETRDDIYKITLDVMDKVLGFGTFDILMRQGEQLKQVAALNLPLGTGVPLDVNGVTVRAFKQQKTMLLNDLSKDEGYYKIQDPDTGQPFTEYPPSMSELSTPIIVNGESIGILNVESTEYNHFTDQDAIFLEILAIHVADAIKRLDSLNRILEQETQFTQFAESSQDMIWIYNIDKGYTYVNSAVETVFGFPKDQMLNDPDFGLHNVVPEDRHIVTELNENARAGTLKPGKAFFRFTHQNGDIKYAEEWYSPICDENGKIVSLQGSIRDITPQIIYRENLKALNEHASKLGTSNTIEEIAQITLDILKNILQSEFASFQTVESQKLVTIQTIGFPSLGWELDLNGPGVTPRVAREKRTIIVKNAGEEPEFLGSERMTNSELAVPVILNNQAVAVINIEDTKYDYYTNEDKQIVELLAQHVASAMERIQTRKDYLEAQQKLIEEHVKLERAKEMDEIKTRFISTATHEIRTPLTSIKGYIEIIGDSLKKTSDEKTLYYFSVVERNLDRLEYLTNDLLDLQRIESNKMSIEITPTSIEELISNVQQEMLPLIREKEQVIEIQRHLKSKTISLDKLRIHQVLINLVSNASRYSPKKTKITLTINEKPSELEFAVTDQGRGIEPDNMEKLFTAFPDIVYPDIQRGTGLGLAICKGIVELHKGKIWADSEGKGKGSTFIFTIPKN
jgi:PAS domain S-box-containing protein